MVVFLFWVRTKDGGGGALTATPLSPQSGVS